MKEITKYFRNAIAVSTKKKIVYEDEKFVTITQEEIEQGRINVAHLDTLWSRKLVKSSTEEKEDKSENLIIALKTVMIEFLDGEKTRNNSEEMSSLLFLPAKVYEDGTLIYQEDKCPWIPREYLVPMIEPQMSIGSAEDYDIFLDETVDERNQIDSWEKYLKYAEKMFEFVTKTEFSEEFIGEQHIKTDRKFYAFIDDTVKSTIHIKNLYNQLLIDKEPKLYSKIIRGIAETTRMIPDKLERKKMIYHSGQMGGEYPLSPSQREAISCFEEIEEGEILAVNGPPGTGKTTLLQTIVANMYVKAAIEKRDAPMIVATSANNQAVTNIIESFGKINPIGIKNLEKRWITGIHSFAVYFPSGGKIKEAIEKDYHYTTVKGTAFFETIESDDNRKEAKELFAEQFSEYFYREDIPLEKTEHYIHSELKKIEMLRIKCIDCLEKVRVTVGNYTTGEYIGELQKQLLSIEEQINQGKKKKDRIEENSKKMLERCKEWRNLYNDLPWYVRFLKFIPSFNKKIRAWSYQNMNHNELEFLNREMTIDEIEEVYYQKIKENDMSFEEMRKVVDLLEKDKQKCIEADNYIRELIYTIENIFAEFSAYNIFADVQEFYTNIDIARINNLLDKVRYVQFWLAVHYYESRWINEECTISEKQKGTTYENVLDKMYRRLAMLTPCMVMTCYMMPKQFQAYDGDNNYHYMYSYADLLIVDEAGQISPEIGVPAFAFAKKAIVVGDEQQIPPVWSILRTLDIAMAISNGVISNKEQFVILEDNGLNCSQSSIMKIASLACPYEKEYGKGLFLSEHRRCYDEIIKYCNALVYRDSLEPMRGSASADSKYVLKNYLPPMGHKQIDSLSSRRIGTSRQNENEAKQIVAWVKVNYPNLLERYKKQAEEKGEDFDAKNILGIITPFKSQSLLIIWMLRKQLPEIAENIAVGTVHTFQGAERKVIIFSSVYGSKEGCYFINSNKSLMNVAVSRAKDSFLVFGDSGCLVGNDKSAGTMLRATTRYAID